MGILEGGEAMSKRITNSQSVPDEPIIRARATFSGNQGKTTLNPKVAAKIAQMPPSFRATYPRAMTGKSLRAAVNAFCAECVGYQRDEVRFCTSPACPFYQFRPFQQRSKT